jgi:hypothetical protein
VRVPIDPVALVSAEAQAPVESAALYASGSLQPV